MLVRHAPLIPHNDRIVSKALVSMSQDPLFSRSCCIAELIPHTKDRAFFLQLRLALACLIVSKSFAHTPEKVVSSLHLYFLRMPTDRYATSRDSGSVCGRSIYIRI